MIKKENKIIQFTCDPDTLALLKSLESRFHITKTEIIKQALKYYGAKKKHNYSVYLHIPKEIEYQQETEEQVFSETEKQDIIKIAKYDWLKED